MAGATDLPFQIPEVEYDRYTNRQLVAVPLGILAVALLLLLAWSMVVTGTPTSPGPPVTPGLAFTGGTELQIQTTASPPEIRETFEADVESIQPIRSQANTFIVTFQSTDTAAISRQAESAGYEIESIQGRSAQFGAESQRQALIGVGLAFIGMSVLVFLMFRTFVPSIAVVASAFSDIVIPLALMNVFGIELSLGTVAALLMIIGYSVDSDLLLNNHVLRRRGGFYESTYRAMRTGVTMTVTSIAAMTAMTVMAAFFGIELLQDIGLVLVFGLTADLLNTYMMNVSLLRYYKYEGIAK